MCFRHKNPKSLISYLICQNILKSISFTVSQSFFSIETDKLKITENCSEMDIKKKVSLKNLTLPMETTDL